jgi:hypothetical protein
MERKAKIVSVMKAFRASMGADAGRTYGRLVRCKGAAAADQPRDTEQVAQADDGAAEVVVFRPSGRPGAMGDIHMRHVPSIALEERGQIAVHVIEIGQREIGLPPERLEPAAGIPRAVPQKPSTDRVGRARGQALGQRIVALGPLSGHERQARRGVFVQKRCQQDRDLLGRVLAVTVERADERGARGAHGVVDGGRLSCGAGMGDDRHGQVGMGGGEAFQRHAGVVARAVIGHADLERAQWQRRRAAGLQKRHRRLSLVEHRDHDRETRRRLVSCFLFGLVVRSARHACDNPSAPDCVPAGGLARV